ncbi:hypothetical protein [Streptomyces shenzhenensis]|uniref:hypothetical protein n=1 Tax=Streptomyces shenzhenensis TaxID=943815 RepID=UPI00368EC80F
MDDRDAQGFVAVGERICAAPVVMPASLSAVTVAVSRSGSKADVGVREGHEP